MPILLSAHLPKWAILERILFPALLLLLIATWCFGGVVKDSTSHDEWLQLLALPVIALAIMILSAAPPSDRLIRAGLLLAALVVLVPALQLLPLPHALSSMAPARANVAADLAAAGVADAPRWSLAPYATETALWACMPALAAFLAGIALPARYGRPLLTVIVVLILLNLPFAVFQTGLPPDSDLRIYPYPDGVSIFGGLFINQNHHATALLFGTALAIGLAIDAWRSRSGKRGLLAVLYGGAAVVCLGAIPLTSSRAGMVLVLPVLAGMLLLGGVLPLARIGTGRRATAVAVVLAVLGVAGAWLGLHLLAVAKAEDPRFLIAATTFRLGLDYFPWGSGIGSFTQAFEANLPKSLWMPNYVNHAHNEYAQWWLTGGLPSMLVLAFGLLIFARAGSRIFSARGRSTGVVVAAACWVSIAAALVHSWVDFPLSTTTLMTVTALLAGVMLTGIAEGEQRSQRGRGRRTGMETV